RLFGRSGERGTSVGQIREGEREAHHPRRSDGQDAARHERREGPGRAAVARREARKAAGPAEGSGRKAGAYAQRAGRQARAGHAGPRGQGGQGRLTSPSDATNTELEVPNPFKPTGEVTWLTFPKSQTSSPS